MVALSPDATMLPYPGRSPPSRRKVPSSRAWISFSPHPGAVALIASTWARALIWAARRSRAISRRSSSPAGGRWRSSSERATSHGCASLSCATNRLPRVSASPRRRSRPPGHRAPRRTAARLSASESMAGGQLADVAARRSRSWPRGPRPASGPRSSAPASRSRWGRTSWPPPSPLPLDRHQRGVGLAESRQIVEGRQLEEARPVDHRLDTAPKAITTPESIRPSAPPAGRRSRPA